jgi:hypothetical protein
MHPGPADLPSRVLPQRYLLSATAAALPGGARGVGLAPVLDRFWPESDRAGTGHRYPDTPGTEMLQMRLTYSCAYRRPPCSHLGPSYRQATR